MTNTKLELEQEPRIVSQKEWVEAQKAHLAKEKEFTRLRDRLSKERRELPWVSVEKNYIFETSEGKKTLADLFDGRSQLIVYHFMFGPEWEEGCPSCSFLSDHSEGARIHLEHHDVKYVAISRAPLSKIEPFKKRMGWKFDWASSNENDFNYDYHVSFTEDEIAKGEMYYNYEMQNFPSEEAHGISVFYKDETGDVFHTYSSYARGGDIFLGTYNFLDITPKGRNETEIMEWVRHHDKYPGNTKKETLSSNSGACH